MRGKHKLKASRKWLRRDSEDLIVGVANEDQSFNKPVRFSPGLMKYDGQGKFTFYKVKPRVIFKFIWDVLIHGKPGTRKDKRIR